jgi:serine/threonine-protein kinase RsbW
MTPADEDFSYTLERDLKSLDALRESMATYLRERALDERTVAIVELCCYEAVANIIEHSQPSEVDNLIRVRCSLHDRRVRCEIIHCGPEFDLTQAPMPDIRQHFKQGKNQGLGIYMIRTLMNEVAFTHERGRNTLVITKNL